MSGGRPVDVARLAAALVPPGQLNGGAAPSHLFWLERARALLPIVDEMARRWAAEELDAAADDAEVRGQARQATAYRYAASYLRVLALPESQDGTP